MTQIDEPNLNEQIESDLLDMWLLWERGNWYLNDDHPNYNKEHDRRFRDAIVEYITKLIANQVREAIEQTFIQLSQLYDQYSDECFRLGINDSPQAFFRSEKVKEYLGTTLNGEDK